MAIIGKCYMCPKEIHVRILIAGLCPYHRAHPVTEKKSPKTEKFPPIPERKPSKPYKKRTPINTHSKKRKKAEAEYSILAKEYKVLHPVCEAKVPRVCTGKTRDVHHKKGRGVNLCKVEYFMAICGRCHDWIKENSAEALQLGLIIRRNGPKSN